jgi:hypothetical protein
MKRRSLAALAVVAALPAAVAVNAAASAAPSATAQVSHASALTQARLLAAGNSGGGNLCPKFRYDPSDGTWILVGYVPC